MPLKIISGTWILYEYSRRQKMAETGRSVLGERQVLRAGMTGVWSRVSGGDTVYTPNNAYERNG